MDQAPAGAIDSETGLATGNTMRLICLSVITVTLFTMLAANRARCATRLTEDFTELVKMAEAIVEAEVVDQKVLNEDGAAVTVASLRVLRVHKGVVPPAIDVQYPGGFDGQLLQTASGAPKLSTGRTALLLLARTEDHWRVVGGDVGQVNLYESVDGEAIARRECGKFDYYETEPGSLSGYTRIQSSAISLKSLHALVSAIVSSGRPVIEPAGVIASPPAITQNTVNNVLATTVKLAADPPAPATQARHPLLQASVYATAFLLGLVLIFRRYRQLRM